MDDELHDWEVLHGSDTESTDSIISDVKSKSSSVIDDGMILSDNFSTTDLSQSGLIEPGDSSRVDYVSEPPVVVGNESGIYDSNNGDGEVSLSDVENANGRHIESESSVEEPIEDLRSDSGGNELVSRDSEIVIGEEEIVSTEEVEAVRCDDESKSKEIVWWKMPFVLFKYSVFKISPVWSVSMAAAVMGLVLLGRRLYNMKKKSQSFHLKVTIDNKKVSRVTSQAARLNEVFTEVRRVPVIRSSLPSPVAWPVLSLR